MIAAIVHLYRHAAAYARACPWVFLVPVLFEGLQHVVEWKLGLFASRAAAHALANDPWRIGFGSLKVLALLLPGYWVTRWFAWSDARRATAWDAAAVRRFAMIFLLSAVLSLTLLWTLTLGGPAIRKAMAIGQLALIPTGLLFAYWTVAAALGRADAGPIVSARIMAPDLPYALAVLVAATVPTMIVHYALNYAAMGRPPGLAIPLTALDAVFVGYQIVVMTGAHYVMARHAVARRPARAAIAGAAPLPA